MTNSRQTTARKTPAARKQPTLSGLPVDPLPKGFVSANSVFPSNVLPLPDRNENSAPYTARRSSFRTAPPFYDSLESEVSRLPKKSLKIFEDTPSDQNYEPRGNMSNSGSTAVLGVADVHTNAGRYQSQGEKGELKTALDNLYRSKLQKVSRASGKKMTVGRVVRENVDEDTGRTEETASVVDIRDVEDHDTTHVSDANPASFEALLAGATLLTHVSALSNNSTSSPTLTAAALSNNSTPTSALSASIVAAHASKPKGKRIPSLERVWKLSSFKGKTSRGAMEEFVRLCGRNPEEKRFKDLDCEELAEYVRGWQLLYKEGKEAEVVAASAQSREDEKNSPATALKNVTSIRSVAGPSPSSKAQQSLSPVARANKRPLEFAGDDEGASSSITKRIKLEPRRKGIRKVARASPSSVIKQTDLINLQEGVKQPTERPVLESLAEVTKTLLEVKHIVHQELSNPSEISADSENGGNIEMGGNCMLILFDKHDNPRISLRAQQIVRSIVRLGNEIEAAYKQDQKAPIKESDLLYYKLREFKSELDKLSTEVARVICGNGVDANEEARVLVNRLFAGGIEYGQI